jgi:hypothetical protein
MMFDPTSELPNKMKVTITSTAQAGQAGEIRIFLDQEEYLFDYNLSRILTDTDNEQKMGFSLILLSYIAVKQMWKLVI